MNLKLTSSREPGLFYKLLISLIFTFLFFIPQYTSASPVLAGTSLTMEVQDSLYSYPLSNAEITLTSTALPIPLKSTINNVSLIYNNLPAGDYFISVSAPGYITSTLLPLEPLLINQNNNVSIKLVADPSLIGFSYLNFYDTNNTEGVYAGTVNWSTYGNIPSNAEIQIRFFNDQNIPVGDPLITLASATNYQYTLNAISIPPNGTRFGVQLLSNSNVIGLKTLPILEYESINITNFKYSDSNPSLGLSGTVSWTGGDESRIGGYRLYYSIKGSMLNYWDVVAKRPDKTYQYTFSSKLPSNVGAIYLGFNNAFGEELNGYPAAWVLDNRLADPNISATFSPSLPVATNIRDYTYAYSANTIDGQIFLDVPTDVSQIKGFNLYFSNSSGVKIQAIATSYLEGTNPGNYISLNTLTNSSLAVPSEATQFALYSLGEDGTESAPTFIPIKTYTPIPPISNDVFPSNLRFIDLDVDSQKIRGYVTWDKAKDEDQLTSYSIVTLNDSYQVIDTLGEVLKGALPQFTITGATISMEATKIAIRINTANSQTNSASISNVLKDNKSLNDLRSTIKTNYLPGVTRFGVENVLATINIQKDRISFTKDDIELFLSLIEPINSP